MVDSSRHTADMTLQYVNFADPNNWETLYENDDVKVEGLVHPFDLDRVNVLNVIGKYFKRKFRRKKRKHEGKAR